MLPVNKLHNQKKSNNLKSLNRINVIVFVMCVGVNFHSVYIVKSSTFLSVSSIKKSILCFSNNILLYLYNVLLYPFVFLPKNFIEIDLRTFHLMTYLLSSSFSISIMEIYFFCQALHKRLLLFVFSVNNCQKNKCAFFIIVKAWGRLIKQQFVLFI